MVDKSPSIEREYNRDCRSGILSRLLALSSTGNGEIQASGLSLGRCLKDRSEADHFLMVGKCTFRCRGYEFVSSRCWLFLGPIGSDCVAFLFATRRDVRISFTQRV